MRSTTAGGSGSGGGRGARSRQARTAPPPTARPKTSRARSRRIGQAILLEEPSGHVAVEVEAAGGEPHPSAPCRGEAGPAEPLHLAPLRGAELGGGNPADRPQRQHHPLVADLALAEPVLLGGGEPARLDVGEPGPDLPVVSPADRLPAPVQAAEGAGAHAEVALPLPVEPVV